MDHFEYEPFPASRLCSEHVAHHDEWRRRNLTLAGQLERLLRGEEPLPRLRVDLDVARLAAAVGANGLRHRVGLAFSSLRQQEQFSAEFSDLMIQNGYRTFSLAGTGTSFQGLSTNPRKPADWMFGSGDLDLDLQIYCPSMVEHARREQVALFPNMFLYVEGHVPRMARLSTFKNYGEGTERGLDAIAPWIAELERAWGGRLRASYDRECPIHIALMSFDVLFEPERTLGSPFEMVRVVDEAMVHS